MGPIIQAFLSFFSLFSMRRVCDPLFVRPPISSHLVVYNNQRQIIKLFMKLNHGYIYSLQVMLFYIITYYYLLSQFILCSKLFYLLKLLGISLVTIYLSSQIILFTIYLYYCSLLFIITIYSIYCSELFPLMLIHIIAHYHSYLFYLSCQVNLFDIPLIIIIIIIIILIHYFELSIFMIISLGNQY